MRFILASGSPRRKTILRELGIDFIIHPADIDEITSGVYPTHIPVINAIEKAKAVSSRFPEDIVMGADTVIEFDNMIIGKPESPEHATEILSMFSGHTHHVVTAVCLKCASKGILNVFCEDTAVTFKDLSAKDIAAYFERVHVMDKAGAYAIQEHGEMLIESISGSRDNVIGLPGERLLEALHACGLESLILNPAPSL